MRQLFPIPIEDVDPVDTYADLPAVAGRPSVRLNMIASLDGATAVDGVSGGLGGPGDHVVFLALRSLADVVIVAAGTARAEGYGPVALPDASRAARAARGQTPVPALAVVSRSCRLDWRSSFFVDATIRPLVVTATSAPPENLARAAEVAEVVLAGEGGVDLSRAVDALAERGARSVLAEGGPGFNGQLAAAGLLDEVCLTLSPRLVGGDAARILRGGGLASRSELRLRTVTQDGDFLFLRFGVL